MTTTNAQAPESEVTSADGANPVPEPHANPLLRLHLLLYGRYKWAIILGLLFATCGTVAVWNLMPPQYEVVGFIRVKPYIPPVLSATDQNGVLPMFESFVSLQVSLLQSQRVLDQASQNPDWHNLGQHSARWGSKIPADGLTVDHPRNSEIVTVAFADRNPTVAAVAVKSVLLAYQATNGDTSEANDTQRMQVLLDQRTNLTNQKSALGVLILSTAKEYGSDALQARYQFKLEQQNQLESELQHVALEVSIAKAALGGAADATKPATSMAASQPAEPLTRTDVARLDPQMRDFIAEEARLALRLNQLRLRLGDKHPEVLAVKNEQRGLDDQMNAVLKTYQEHAAKTGTPLMGPTGGRITTPLPELLAREANIRALFDVVQSETKALGQKDLEIRKLKEDQDAISHKLEETIARIDQLNLEATTSNRISILSYGESPTAPLPSKRYPLMAAVGLLGIAVGTGLVALRGFADRRVSSLLHMQRLAPAIRVLGMLPMLPEDLTDADQIPFAAHCVHHIRNLLEIAPSHGRGRVLAITSPLAGDGKTSLTLALGLSFAASGSRTLLIDCDMVGCGLTRRLNAIAHCRVGTILLRQGLLTERQLNEALRIAGNSKKKFGEILIALGYLRAEDLNRALTDQQESSVGLLDALAGEPLSACVTPVVMDGLSILPAGNATSEHTSQISGKALRRIIRDASAEYDFIIIDTGPILGSLEASVAACEADEVILAVARGAPSPLVSRTVDFLASVGAHLGGVVFNRATPGDVAHSHYGSSGSLRSLDSSAQHRPSPSEPESPLGAPPRLGPVASAVVTASTGTVKKSTRLNDSGRKYSVKTHGNGSSSSFGAPGDDASQESAKP